MKQIARLCLVSVIGCLMLQSCGFRPMYGTASIPSGAQVALNDIAISNIPNRDGQRVRNALIDRFYAMGRPADARYRLDVAPINETKIDLGVNRNADTTRAQLRLATTFVLMDSQTDSPVLTRSVNSVASYNILASQFTTRVSEQNVRDNALDDLARQIEQQVVLYMDRVTYAPTPAAAPPVAQGQRYKILP